MSQANAQPNLSNIFSTILLVFLAVTLPGAELSLFGWLHPFLPLLVFYVLNRYGRHIGNKLILSGTGLALIAGLILHSLEITMFSLTLLPTGYVLANSVSRHDSPALAGLKGSVTLAACWILLIGGLALTTGTSPYSMFIMTIDSGIDEALQHYRLNDSIAPETLSMLETTFYQMKIILPLIMPAILLSCTLFTTWFTMVVGNNLVRKVCNREAWPGYRTWQLPDRLIWLGITATLCAFLPIAPLRAVCVNLLILMSIIYCFQGLAIFVYYMNKWNVPLLFRSFLYVMIIFQSFGTVLLLVSGVADTWFDFRKLNLPVAGPEEDVTDE